MAQERLSQLQKCILESLLWTKKFRTENPIPIGANEDFINRNEAESVRITISRSKTLFLTGRSLSVSFSRSIRNLERKGFVTLRYIDNTVDTIGLTEEGQTLAKSLNVKANVAH